ncbi:SurA N-terminal domain-containing protein [Rhodobacteraceae bacterium N5(2021)]|uniref:SurA N-terminal domain-containing protein n=1 Tax=Gymnodinialimonas phycosphaerae TaxID=2841589 RepID=A0A975TWG7_9RHOB|nr:SurA N-terminal domain-containing protein [Gymnodinialimonas phycosphaerae]MBY4891685.1 SurA N-terminal domain-containing protein [Gymnodinialimonas phycosphaerae]
MARTAAKKVSNVFVWILMGLLFVALAGFGIGSFNGGASRVGSVGDVEITAEDYFRALNNEINAQIAQTGQAVSFAQIRARGIDAQVLAGLTARAALSHESAEMGISVGDAEVARQISQIAAFQNTAGQFDRNTYEFVLQQQGSSPRDFEEDTREDVARALLQTAVIGGLTPNEIFAETIAAYQAETRDFTRLAVTEGDLPTPIAEPTDAELEAYYEEFPERFTRPEARRITYAWITPSAIMDDVEIDEVALQELYNDRIDEYVQPERRLLERLIFGSDAEVEAALAAIAAEETDFDTLVEDRDLTLEDVDMGVIAADDLSDAAAAIIFSDDESELLGPVPTPLGPALFRVNAVLQASEVPFEDARDDLSAELAQESARRAIDDMREELDDLLASGATLEEMGADTAMTLGTIDYTPASEEGIAAYDNFRDAARAVEQSDFPELLDLSDGGLFALRLDEIVPPSLPPLAEIEGDVADAWQATALREAVADRAAQLVAQLAQGATLEELGDTSEERLIRRQDLLPDLPATTVAQVFQLDAPGDVVMIPGPEAAHIVRLDAINSGVRNAPDTSVILAIMNQTIAQSMATDIFEAYGQALQADAGITTNQGVINSVHASFP